MTANDLPENMLSITDVDTNEVNIVIGLTEETKSEALNTNDASNLDITASTLGYTETSPGVFEKDNITKDK